MEESRKREDREEGRRKGRREERKEGKEATWIPASVVKDNESMNTRLFLNISLVVSSLRMPCSSPLPTAITLRKKTKLFSQKHWLPTWHSFPLSLLINLGRVQVSTLWLGERWVPSLSQSCIMICLNLYGEFSVRVIGQGWDGNVSPGQWDVWWRVFWKCPPSS